MWDIIYAPYTFIHSPSAKTLANWDRMIFQFDFEVKDALTYWNKILIWSVSISFTIFLIWIYTVVWRLSELSRLSKRGYSEWNYKKLKYHDDFSFSLTAITRSIIFYSVKLLHPYIYRGYDRGQSRVLFAVWKSTAVTPLYQILNEKKW